MLIIYYYFLSAFLGMVAIVKVRFHVCLILVKMEANVLMAEMHLGANVNLVGLGIDVKQVPK